MIWELGGQWRRLPIFVLVLDEHPCCASEKHSNYNVYNIRFWLIFLGSSKCSSHARESCSVPFPFFIFQIWQFAAKTLVCSRLALIFRFSVSRYEIVVVLIEAFSRLSWKQFWRPRIVPRRSRMVTFLAVLCRILCPQNTVCVIFELRLPVPRNPIERAGQFLPYREISSQVFRYNNQAIKTIFWSVNAHRLVYPQM